MESERHGTSRVIVITTKTPTVGHRGPRGHLHNVLILKKLKLKNILTLLPDNRKLITKSLLNETLKRWGSGR